MRDAQSCGGSRNGRRFGASRRRRLRGGRVCRHRLGDARAAVVRRTRPDRRGVGSREARAAAHPHPPTTLPGVSHLPLKEPSQGVDSTRNVNLGPLGSYTLLGGIPLSSDDDPGRRPWPGWPSGGTSARSAVGMPGEQPCRHARHRLAGRDVPRHHRTRADERPRADPDASENHRTRADGRSVLDMRR